MIKKDGLIEAIVLEQHKDYKNPLPQSLTELDEFFGRILEYQEKRLLFSPLYSACANIGEVYQIQKGVLRDLDETLGGAFRELRALGLIKTDVIADQPACLTRVIKLICVHSEVFP